MIKFTATLLWIILAVTSLASLADGNRNVIHASADQVQPLLPGMTVPGFVVRDVEGQDVVYNPDKQQRPLVLTFFRGGWCPYCNLHLSELRLAETRLKDMGFDIWFISIDKPELLRASLDDPGTGYTLLSDSKLEATRAFGLAFRVDAATVQRYLTNNIDLESASGEYHHVLPAPATYIIGADGMVNFAYVNPDYKVRLHPDILLAAAGAYRDDEDKRLIRMRKRTK